MIQYENSEWEGEGEAIDDNAGPQVGKSLNLLILTFCLVSGWECVRMGRRGDQCHGGCSGDGVDQVRMNSGWGGGERGKGKGNWGGRQCMRMVGRTGRGSG